MLFMDLMKYIKNVRKTTPTQAARELGYTKQHINQVAKKEVYAGRKLMKKIISWSKGRVQYKDLL